MRAAIVHYWLVNMRGGEKVVEALCEMLPDADVFAHVYLPSAVSEKIRKHRVETTFIQRLPLSTRYYQKCLPLMPLALEQLDLRGYDLVISSESGPAKGVLVSSDAVHICYCHTPMRYLWDLYHDYLESSGFLVRLFMRPVAHYLRLWDLASAARVDHFVANSAHVARRISKHYRREAEVIHPPVDTEAFFTSEEREDFYLMAGQLVPYKRPDVAVDAFNRMGKRLVVVGEGELLPSLKERAGPTVSIQGYQPDAILRDRYARCRALIFPGIEDFGIVPVEAMASGRPVIAFKKGGSLETVVDGKTGLFFDRQTPDSLIDAVRRFEGMEDRFSREGIVRHARRFGRQRFKDQMLKTIERLLAASRAYDERRLGPGVSDENVQEPTGITRLSLNREVTA